MTDRQVFSEFLAALYDCAIAPNVWPHVLPMLADYLESRTAAVSSRSRGSTKPNFLIEFGFDPALHELYISKYAQINPRLKAIAMFGIDEPVRTEDILDMEEFQQSRYFKEFHQPYGLGELLVVKVIEDTQRVVSCAVSRPQAYEQEDIDKFRELCPHIRRVMTISDLLERKTVERDSLAEVVDALSVAVILVDPKSRITHTNFAARKLLAEGGILRSVHGVLTVSGSHDEHHLRIATQTPDLATKSLSLESSDGRSVVATVLPLTSGLRQGFGRAFPASAALFVHDQAPIDEGATAAVAALFGLTGAEVRVLAALLEGRTITETAERYEISANTARTHLQRLFSKTNTNRQSDLLRVVTAALPPVRHGGKSGTERRGGLH